MQVSARKHVRPAENSVRLLHESRRSVSAVNWTLDPASLSIRSNKAQDSELSAEENIAPAALSSLGFGTKISPLIPVSAISTVGGLLVL